MASYAQWKRDGKPVKFGRAVRAFGDRLAAHGYTVYFIGNEDHLTHTPPEDHTPFSATGWPGTHPYPYILATDVMPPSKGQRSKITGKPLPSLQQIGAQLIKDKRSGVAGAEFVKYLNTEPERDNGGPCWHYSWTPNEARRSSSDRGHLHVSSRTDYATSAKSDDYDVVARIMGDDDDMTPEELDKELRDPKSRLHGISVAIPWQYVGGGIPAGMSTLGVLNAIHGYSKATAELVQIIASRDEVDETALGKAIAESLANAVVGLALPQIAAQLDAEASEALAPDAIEAAVRRAVAEVLRDGVGDVQVAASA